MRELNQDEIVEVFLDTPIYPVQRRCTGPDDWGDSGTVKKHLKRHGATVLSHWDHFGVYYGQHEIGYVVGIKGEASFDTVKGEAFETLEEMKSRWELD